MVAIHRGTVEDGQIVLAEALDLPDGTGVVVQVEVADAAVESGSAERTADLRTLPAFGMWADREEMQERPRLSDEEFAALPFFGMWADREEMQDSVAWVRKQREAWTDRLNRRPD